MARVRILSLVVLAFAMLGLMPLPAHAADDKEQQAVYNGEVFDGQGYEGQFYPENEHTIYMMADVTNILIPKQTLVYWWAITKEYKADWDTMNTPLTGTLQIGDASFPMTKYSLRYDGGYSSAQTNLLIGDEALSARAAYQKSMSDYQAATAQYNDLRAKYDDLLEVWGKAVDERRAKGESTEDLVAPKEPVAPTQPTVTVTDPADGIAFKLAAGQYEMKLLGADGKVVPGSERTLVAFASRRTGIAYKVLAESKYTLPDASTDPNDTIFVSGEKALYVQPAQESEYDSYYASKLMNSQQKSVQDRRGIWAWLPTGVYTGTELSLTVNGATQPVNKTQYYAKQNPGGALGYQILPYDASAGEGVGTFEAFQVIPQNGAMSIAAPGVAGSSREIRVVNTGMGNVLLAFAFAPLLGGLGWLSYRRWRTK